MDKQPSISIIVPVYKAEKYLHHCIDSLLAQTFTDFEILLIDDGSPDQSGVICDEYAKNNLHIRVFHKENGGVASARQFGIDNAFGDYTIHVDPDDWVDPEMLSELYKKAKEENTDMVICDFYEEWENNTKYITQKPSSLNHETVLKELFQHLHGSCCNKLVRRACYSSYNIKFPNLNYCEDLFVNIMLLTNPIKVSYVGNAFYHYDRSINPNSLTLKECNRRNLYYKMEAFYNELTHNIDSVKYKDECISLQYKLAFVAIIGRIYSSKEYVSHFNELKLYPSERIKNCTNWEKLMIKISLYGFNYIAYTFIETRHFIGNIKRKLII